MIDDIRKILMKKWGVKNSRIPSADEVLAATFNPASGKLDVNFERTGLLSKEYDYLKMEYPAANIEMYKTYIGGVNGRLQEQVKVTFTDATKDDIDTVEKMQ